MFFRYAFVVQGMRYVLKDQLLQKKSAVRDLGVIHYSKLLFDNHIETIVKKASKVLGFVLRTGCLDKVTSLRSETISKFVIVQRYQKQFGWQCNIAEAIVMANCLSVKKRYFVYSHRKFWVSVSQEVSDRWWHKMCHQLTNVAGYSGIPPNDNE
jgi:hypothetical protein